MFNSLNSYYLQQRFFPGIGSIFINPFYFIRKRLVDKITILAPQLNGKLLDFGCGAKPYKALFKNVESYIGVDIEDEGHHDHTNENIDVYYDGNTIPFDNETFDSILTSEVLEHVPDIDKTLKDLIRVLKPNGKILITVPFVWQEHEMPYDFRRLTVTGLKKHLTDNDLEIITEEKTGHYIEVVTQLWMTYVRSLIYVNNKYINLILNVIFIFPACASGLLLSCIFHKKRELYFNSIILAQKTN